MSLGLKGLRSLMVSYILLSRDALKVNVDVLVHAEKGCWGGGGGGGWVLGWRGGWWEGGADVSPFPNSKLETICDVYQQVR